MKNEGPSASGDPESPGRPDNRTGLLVRYAGLASRYIVILGATVWFGLRADGWIGWPLPILVWVLPLTALVGLIAKAIIDTSDNHSRK